VFQLRQREVSEEEHLLRLLLVGFLALVDYSGWNRGTLDTGGRSALRAAMPLPLSWLLAAALG
jgi:hypothetical protein